MNQLLVKRRSEALARGRPFVQCEDCGVKAAQNCRNDNGVKMRTPHAKRRVAALLRINEDYA